jgi:hypothetical protein
MPGSFRRRSSDAHGHLKRALPNRALLGLLTGLVLPSSPTWAATLRVPSDYSAIQQAIDAAAPGDEILVAAGLYDENLDTKGKQLTLLSESGPDQTIIDGGRRNSVLILGAGGVVDGLTLQNGYAETDGGGVRILGSAPALIRNNVIQNNEVGSFDSGVGGGIYLDFTTSGVVIESNTIRGNFAGDSGGGAYDRGSGNTFRGNQVYENRAHVCGGGILVGVGRGALVEGNLVVDNFSDSFGGGLCVDGDARIENNTVIGNGTGGVISANGAGIDVVGGRPWVARNVVVGNGGPGSRGVGIYCSSEFSARIECNNSWGNTSGDYVLFGACDTTSGRNFSLDPLFCDEDAADYSLDAASPCAPGSASSCGLVGAYPVGCGATQAESASWGRVKALYR